MKQSNGDCNDNVGIGKKVLLSTLAIVFMVVGGIIVNAAFTQTPVDVHARDSVAMRQEMDELRASIAPLLESIDSVSEQENTAQISSQRAREIAVELIGHGMASDVALSTHDGVSTFEVDVRHDDDSYVVFVDAATGNVMRMSRHDDAVITALDEITETQGQSAITAQQLVSALQARANESSVITRQQAIDLAREHLDSIGRGGAAFRYAYANVDNGRPVWRIEFVGELEFYVCRNTGTFFKSPTAEAAIQHNYADQTVNLATPSYEAVAPVQNYWSQPPVVYSPPVVYTPPVVYASPSPNYWSSPSPNYWSSPSPSYWSSPSPAGWSSPSPGGWSSPSPANPRWTGTGGREWTWGT
jgi:uncharacterized membrane protein YkoI